MDRVKNIFQHLRPDPEKLRLYGFTAENGAYLYRTSILGGQFALTVTVKGGEVSTLLLDAATEEPYALHLVEEAAGAFVGQVRTEFEAVLKDVAARCFVKEIFKSEVTKSLISRVFLLYGDEPEYLWDKFPENAVFRRKDNRKWYSAILTVGREKLGLAGGGNVEVLDVRADPEEIVRLVDGRTVFGGWHMNKKHWISLPLDGTLPIGEIENFLRTSYALAAKN